MKVFLQSLGTRGDVEPYLAVAHRLQACGHTATFCTSRHFAPWIQSYGVEYGQLNNDLIDLLHSQDGRVLMGNAYGMLRAIRAGWRLRDRLVAMNRRMVQESWAAVCAAKFDCILYHPKAFACAHFAEKLGIPAFASSLQPVLVSTGSFPCSAFPPWPMGRFYCRLTYWLGAILGNAVIRGAVNDWRRTQGMAPVPFGDEVLRHGRSGELPVLQGFSQYVVPPPPEWQPPESLVRFLESGPPPVYVGFGSMAGPEGGRVARVVVDALKQVGVRGLLAMGWGGLDPEALPPTMMAVREVPHARLFGRVAAVVHHGGAGTTAAGLRAGKPTVICPFLVDQPFWGRRVQALGAGPAPIPHKDLTVSRLADALRTVLGSTQMRECAEGIGRHIRSEDGASNAVELLSSYV